MEYWVGAYETGPAPVEPRVEVVVISDNWYYLGGMHSILRLWLVGGIVVPHLTLDFTKQGGVISAVA